jgi:hypothetical protein
LTSMQGVSVRLNGHAHAPATHVHNFNISSAHAHVCGRDSHTCSHSRVHSGVKSTRHALAHPHPHPHPPAVCTRRTHTRTSTSTRTHAPLMRLVRLVRLIRTVKIARVDLSLCKFKTDTKHTRAWSTARTPTPTPPPSTLHTSTARGATLRSPTFAHTDDASCDGTFTRCISVIGCVDRINSIA